MPPEGEAPESDRRLETATVAGRAVHAATNTPPLRVSSQLIRSIYLLTGGHGRGHRAPLGVGLAYP